MVLPPSQCGYCYKLLTLKKLEITYHLDSIWLELGGSLARLGDYFTVKYEACLDVKCDRSTRKPFHVWGRGRPLINFKPKGAPALPWDAASNWAVFDGRAATTCVHPMVPPVHTPAPGDTSYPVLQLPIDHNQPLVCCKPFPAGRPPLKEGGTCCDAQKAAICACFSSAGRGEDCCFKGEIRIYGSAPDILIPMVGGVGAIAPSPRRFPLLATFNQDSTELVRATDVCAWLNSNKTLMTDLISKELAGQDGLGGMISQCAGDLTGIFGGTQSIVPEHPHSDIGFYWLNTCRCTADRYEGAFGPAEECPNPPWKPS